MAFYLRVEKKNAQKTMDSLKRNRQFDLNYRVFWEEESVWIPVKEGVPDSVKIEREPISRKPRSVDEALAGIISEEERTEVVSSFDLIGDVAIVEIPEALVSKEKEIAKALMKVHKNVRVVTKKEGPMEGAYRVRKLKVIYGEGRTETEYRESGVRMLLDVAKVYFSPRLSFERKRISELVKNGERILALFAGVGPFPLVIARARKDCEIVAIELNPVAVEYMKKNIKLNKTRNMAAICGDVKEIVPRDYANWADRVLMPLPKDAEYFLDAAYAGAKDGATIHFYTFADIKEPFADAERKIAAHLGKGKYEIMNERVVRPFSPSRVQVVIDLRVKKRE